MSFPKKKSFSPSLKSGNEGITCRFGRQLPFFLGEKNREVTTGDEVVQRYGDTVDGQHQETTKDDDYPIIFRVLKIPGGAGFCPSTV